MVFGTLYSVQVCSDLNGRKNIGCSSIKPQSSNFVKVCISLLQYPVKISSDLKKVSALTVLYQRQYFNLVNESLTQDFRQIFF